MKWYQKIIIWLKPRANKAVNLYIDHHELIAKGVPLGIKLAKEMGYVKEGKEAELEKQIKKGMKQAAEELAKRQNKKGEIWKFTEHK